MSYDFARLLKNHADRFAEGLSVHKREQTPVVFIDRISPDPRHITQVPLNEEIEFTAEQVSAWVNGDNNQNA